MLLFVVVRDAGGKEANTLLESLFPVLLLLNIKRLFSS